jgi:hypothetical protein
MGKVKRGLLAISILIVVAAASWLVDDLWKTAERRAKRAAEAAELFRARGYDCSEVRVRRIATDAFGSRYFIASCDPYGPFIDMVRMGDGNPLTIAE